ncbi:hypothetical protein [Heliorestis convoluta]|uniref:Uncharacterized protein n=1 Tax=Heliorestis convoluta TaxID=356322 RepID=A0A5Q2N314_9FIRM|nr:hypothetical protein [Heliorestis convoluta]QGG46965.1 hypothetical protein FTV88_0789 [Heliorestis convoluta]
MSSKKSTSMISKIPGFRTGTPWKMGLAAAFYVFILFYAYLLTTSSSNESPQEADITNNEQSIPVTASVQEQPTEPVRTLGITTDEFKSSFNALATLEIGDLTIDEFAVTEGRAQDVVRFSFRDLYEIMGTVNKDDNTLRNISIIGPGGDELVTYIEVLIGATDSSIEGEGIALILDELGLRGTNFDLSSMKTEYVYNEHKYIISGTKVLGLTFTIQHRFDR